jgi:cytochrome c-type biogenesis protein CcmH/NrfG
MAKKTKPGAKSKNGSQPGKRGGKLFLLIILAPIVIALGGGTMLYVWSKKNAESGGLAGGFTQIKLEGVDPAIVKLVGDARAAVEKAPRSGAAWGRLGITLAVHDFIDQADSCFAQAEKYEPGEVRWPYWHGLALAGTNVEKALPFLERAAMLCTNVPAVVLRYAEALVERGRLDEAEKQILRVSSQDTNNVRALLGLGRIALGRDELSDSLEYLTRLMAVATNIGPAYTLLATVQQRLGNAAEAEKARRVAATLPETPEWPDPFLREANTYRTGKESAVAFAESLLQQGRAKDAVALMKETTRVYPGFVRGWIVLGQSMMAVKDFAGAEKAFRNADRLAPDSVEIRTELGGALFAEGRYSEAESCYRETVRAMPNEAEGWFNLGLCLMNQRNNEAAIEAFRTAARVKPDFTYSYIRWGQALGRLKREAEAMEQLRHALQLSPENSEAKEMLEILQKTKGEKTAR